MRDDLSYTVLIIEDEPVLARNIQIYLERGGMKASWAPSAEAGLSALDAVAPDIVILDHNLPARSGLQVLGDLRRSRPHLPVVMMTGHGSEQVAVEAMKAGAVDYLVKPVALAHLRQVLDRVIAERRQREAWQQPPAEPSAGRRSPDAGGLGSLVGESPAMQTLRERIRQVLDADLRLGTALPPSVLIVGETGTGKELVARALHFEGPRRDGPWVEINCASLPANLVESELFGHERGAFTDARERRVGLVEAADGGTLFLDEVGELELSTQAKLLKMLEDRQVRRLGSVQTRPVQVRVVAATHRPLDRLVQEGRFRSDLFFRLGIVRIDLPPLRERAGDVERLARHFIALQAERYAKPGLHFSESALARLNAHGWPGNVRELANLAEQCAVLARASGISEEELPLDTAATGFDALPRASAGLPPGATLAETERHMLQAALASHDWNVTQAARALGISRDTLRYRIEKFQLKPDRA